MKIVSLNVGLPREVVWHGRPVLTGIYKSPVDGRVVLRTENLDGDRQADLTVHGGKYKAVYCYPREHYSFWTGELARELSAGAFGENFTTEGLSEDTVRIGDRFAIGSAEVVVTQPRLPCYKLGIRFESDEMVKRFFASGRTGFYAAVAREGEVGAGDEVRTVERAANGVPVSEITRLYATKRWSGADAQSARAAIATPALPESWKDWLRGRL
jgi:MOSC domain-containing protein YiiM